MSEIIYLAEAHKHDEHTTYEARFRLARLSPKDDRSPQQSVLIMDQARMDEYRGLGIIEGDCAYTFMHIPANNRMSWQEDTPEAASKRLASLGLECFKVLVGGDI